jgi:hypothetical protein
MRIILLFIFSPLFLFASFPVKNHIFLDTIIENGKVYKEISVDSLYKFPLEGETLQEYKSRLKRNQVMSKNLDLVKSKRQSWSFWQIVGLLAIIWLIICIFILMSALTEFD